MNPLLSLADYEQFIYTLLQQFPSIRRSTLTVIRRGVHVVRVIGNVEFDDGYRLNVREKIAFDNGPGVVEDYGYEVWREAELLFWYDSQPHPDNPALASTHPHHKHTPPDIKHNRIPASGLSLVQPNIPALVLEVEALIVGTRP